MDDVPFPENRNTERGEVWELRACMSLVGGRLSFEVFWGPLKYVIKG